MAFIDLHCHMLPGIDDGAKSTEQALAMARQAQADGIRSVVVTPHHLNGVYLNLAEDIRQAVRAFKLLTLANGIGIQLLPGSELHLVPELPDALERGEAMTIADRGRAVLVELPVFTVPVGADQILDDLLGMGLTPVIAHPERNRALAERPERLADWVERGCLAQVTAQSCTGAFGTVSQNAAKTMIGNGWIHVMASDAHRDRRRIPQLSLGRDMVASWTSPELARLLVLAYPKALINGQDVDRSLLLQALAALPGQQQRRPWWRLFRRS
ncbi:MAG: hypothetical protein M0Q42_05025 [Xanthomonadales bacterium]|nr:hypothetical protein [Xanthomonadales bacterium]